MHRTSLQVWARSFDVLQLRTQLHTALACLCSVRCGKVEHHLDGLHEVRRSINAQDCQVMLRICGYYAGWQLG